MVAVKKNYAKNDCINYKTMKIKGCCGRWSWGGVCTVPDPDGIARHKICSTKMHYCNYIPKEEKDVHS